jgi:Fe-S-cluster-containing dehydrogenase component
LQFSLQLAVDENETAECVDWVIPEKHALETWSDAKAYDGTLSFSQPLISPMYSGISQSELLHFILTGEKKTDRLLLNEIYQKKWGLAFESRMQEALRQGLVSNSQSDLFKVQSRAPLENFAPKNSPPKDSFEILFQTDRKLYDGRFANHPWLQELPGALSRLAWGNALHLNPKDLDQRNLKSGDVVELKSDGKKISIPVFSDPLQSLSSGTLSFGYGRTRAGNVGSGIGHDVYPLWNGQDFLSNVTVTQTSEFEKLANVQEHHSMEGRDIVRTVKKGEKAAKFESPVSLYSENPIPENEIAWAMSIDLDRCTGCGACVIACQSENNIPTVGKEGVLVGREMHWIRVDRYFETEEATTVHFQPVPCMHCEKAPCEPVCPTGATVHGNGGLNQMVYNRCVGTRYCSNNCPYKVRRFNFLTYNDKNSKLAARQKNPDVTVRTRGVMEKCTYCVQRISAARIKSARDRTPLIDGSVKTACQTTCPSHAIVFGNLMDETSEVSKLRKSYRNYGLLEELGTRPRTTYLAKVSKEGQS